MKKLVRLTESDLHRIVKESVNKVLYNEGIGDRLKGAVSGFRSGNNQQMANSEDASTLDMWVKTAQRVQTPEQAMQFVRNFVNNALANKRHQYDWYDDNREYNDSIA
jgi:hypothetical protein